jgi:hypothetical protein
MNPPQVFIVLMEFQKRILRKIKASDMLQELLKLITLNTNDNFGIVVTLFFYFEPKRIGCLGWFVIKSNTAESSDSSDFLQESNGVFAPSSPNSPSAYR